MEKGGQLPQPLPPINKSSIAWKIFDAFVTQSQLDVTEDELCTYALTDLKLSEYGQDKLPTGFIENLPVMLVAFMNMWSGWKFRNDFFAGKFPKEHYYNRFQNFMMHKINNLIHGQFSSAMKDLAERDLQENGPISKKEPEFVPYAISISCPAHMLNTIVFSTNDDDVIMKQHLGGKWLDLNPVQLVNWPHIEVVFQSDDLYFVRRQATEFVRYLNFKPLVTDNKDAKLVIERAESHGRQDCYSYNFLERYIRTYLNALTTAPEVSHSKLLEIQTILVQFIEDVKFIDINKSMATNTVVLFRLTPMPFIRNKKLVKSSETEGDEARVGYCEMIRPKIQLCLIYFKAIQKEGPTLSFVYTDQIKDPAEHSNINVIPHIKYRCTFCKVEYDDVDSRDLILLHMKTEHKMEQHVRCTLCKKQFEVLALAACRWRHKCQATSE